MSIRRRGSGLLHEPRGLEYLFLAVENRSNRKEDLKIPWHAFTPTLPSPKGEDSIPNAIRIYKVTTLKVQQRLCSRFLPLGGGQGHCH